MILEKYCKGQSKRYFEDEDEYFGLDSEAVQFAHDQFSSIMQCIGGNLAAGSFLDYKYCMVTDFLSFLYYMGEEGDYDWQTYFGITTEKEDKDFDFWEDISEVEDAFGKMFVEEVH